MPAVGGGGRGNSGRRKVVRRKPPPRPPASFIPGAGAVVHKPRPVRAPKPTPRQVQRVTAQARPLASKPVKPKTVKPRAPRAVHLIPVVGEAAKHGTKPLQAKPPRNIKAGKPVKTAKQRRAVAVAAYNELSGAEKHAQVRHAEKRQRHGKANETDKAILHAHKTRVAGNKQRAAASKAFDALTEPRRGLHVDPRVELAGQLHGTPFRKRAGSVATLPSVRKIVSTIAPLSAKGLEKTPLPKVIKNIPKDIGELATTSPSSVAKFVTSAVKDPKQAAKDIAKPYEELAKDPVKFATERPVSTALMVAPGARLPGRAAGKVARVAGKQKLARPSATLPHTALKQERVGSRSAGRRVVQARKDAKQGAPVVTKTEIDRRVDESFAANQVHAERVRSSLLGEAHKEAKKRPKAERKEVLREADENVGKAVVAQKRRRYAEEFGATARVENGRVVEQPQATSPHLHTDVNDAHAVKEHLNAKAQTVQRGHGGISDPVGRLYAKEKLPVEYTVRDAGYGKYAVMPKQVADRLNVHGRIGKEKAVPAVVLRQSRRMFSKAVLPYHPTWLSGQAIEGTVRTAVAGAGPTSWMRARRLEARHPDMYKALAERAVPGGQYGRTIAKDMTERTLAQELPESNVARAFTELGTKPGVKQVRQLNDAVTGFIFNRLNGQLLEGVPQKTILGRALKQHPLMDRHMVGLSNKAIDEFAKGARGTETHVQLAREVVRSYGRYSAFSPRLRSLIMHWTPFIPWYLNMSRFLLHTLPKDHPLAAGLVADISAAEEDWRKEQGLSLRYRNENTKPSWMLGGYPVQGGTNLVRIGHYVPAASSEPGQDVASMVLPQLSSLYGALRYGVDWKGETLKHSDGSEYNEGERLLYGGAQLIESLVPGAAQVAYASGAPEILGGPAESDTKTLKQRVVKQAMPISVVPLRQDQKERSVGRVRVTPVRVKRVKVKRVRVAGG